MLLVAVLTAGLWCVCKYLFYMYLCLKWGNSGEELGRRRNQHNNNVALSAGRYPDKLSETISVIT